MRTFIQKVGLILVFATVVVAAMFAGPLWAQGPVVLMGIDAEDGGVGGHGPITVYDAVVSSILSNVSNGGSGIVVIGGGKSAGDNVTTFWNKISTDLGVAVTYRNGNSITATVFSSFAMIAVVSDVANTPVGGLTAAENALLTTRQGDIANFVNTGGGLLGFTSDFGASAYAYLGGIGSFDVIQGLSYADITPTPAGLAIGINNSLDVCCWHDVYTNFPSFLQVLATDNIAGTGFGQAAAIGGNQVVVPTDLMISPLNATNNVGDLHTVIITATSNNVPIAGVIVTNVVTGANSAAGSCITGAGGTCTFSYVGTNPGTDTITAFATINGQPKTALAKKTWVVSGCPNNSACDDGDPCTVDICSNGVCLNIPINCDDGDPCTTDICSNGVCFNIPINCDDGDPCTVDICSNGVCFNIPINCDDGDPCTVDICSNGICFNIPIDCDDGDPCTTDICSNGVCFHIPGVCDGSVVEVNPPGVTINFNTGTPSYGGDPALLPYFSYDNSGPTPSSWKAIFDLGAKKLLVKSGATIKTTQVPASSNNRQAPGIVIKSTCSVQTEPGSYIAVGSLNRQAGDILIQVDGDVTIGGVVSNSVDGTRGRPGNITIGSQCGSILTGPGSRVITYGQDYGGSDINLAACQAGDISINGLVDASYKAAVASTIRIASFGGSVFISGVNPLGTEVVAGTLRTITSGVSVRSRRDPLPGTILIQAFNDIDVRGSTLLSKKYPNYGAVAVKTASNSSKGGLIDARAGGQMRLTDRSLDNANRYNATAMTRGLAGGGIGLQVSTNIDNGASNNSKPVVTTQGGDTGKGGTNELRGLGTGVSVGAGAQVLADFSGRPGAVGTNILSGCTGVVNLGVVLPANDSSDDTGVCGTPDPLFLDCGELGLSSGN